MKDIYIAVQSNKIDDLQLKLRDYLVSFLEFELESSTTKSRVLEDIVSHKELRVWSIFQS